jgi:hypothetical protein
MGMLPTRMAVMTPFSKFEPAGFLLLIEAREAAPDYTLGVLKTRLKHDAIAHHDNLLATGTVNKESLESPASHTVSARHTGIPRFFPATSRIWWLTRFGMSRRESLSKINCR